MLHLDYIRARCGSTAAWRNSLIAKYPDDVSRNITARDLLRTIAVMSEDDAPVETKAALAKLCRRTGVCASRAKVLRLVGFRYVLFTLEDVVMDIIARVQPEKESIITSGSVASTAHDNAGR